MSKREGGLFLKIKEGKRPNRLVNEKSPYLLQHAYNPVEWYPWGEEAFTKAKAEDKPIFLSIGYSTCHWCHVMERESFEDEEVADLLNRHFVPVKVDREERPDIDQIYMTVCQAMTGHGGWPLTIIMTPDQKPFFAGTYFPKRSMGRHPGLMEILTQIREYWQHDRDKLLSSGDRITRFLKESSGVQRGPGLGWREIDRAFEEHCSLFDFAYGGFGEAPKFPTPHHLTFLLRYAKERNNGEALQMAFKTLDAMYRGGIYDHLGFGFARYSVDRKWLIPHFEKMLYDNALLAYAYLEAYQVSGNERYAKVAREIFAYVQREMTAPEGGFYSAEDADSEGEEGKFYLWTPDEIKAVLGNKEGEWFCRYYGVTDKGNFEGKTILNRIHPDFPDVDEQPYVDGAAGIRVDAAKLEEMRRKLFAARGRRVRPHKDDKILTAWNGLMIAALAKGARVLQEPEYATWAGKSVEFILNHLVRKDGRLLARYRDGEAAFPAYVDDYAFFVWGLMELYEATFEARYLEMSLHWTEEMLRLFWDEEHGGLYFYGSDAEALLLRPKEIYDGAMPSGNSVAALNLLRLSRIAERNDLLEKAEGIFQAFSGQVSQHPFAYAMLMQALLFYLQETKEIVFTGPRDESGLPTIGKRLQSLFLPEAVLIYHDEQAEEGLWQRLVPYISTHRSIDGKPTVYLCRNYACQEPATDFDKVAEQLLWQKGKSGRRSCI